MGAKLEALFEVWQGVSSSQKDVGQDRKWDKVQMIQPTFIHGVGKTESSPF